MHDAVWGDAANTHAGHGTAVDWWAFGILVYEFLVGQPPFWDQNPMKIYEQYALVFLAILCFS